MSPSRKRRAPPDASADGQSGGARAFDGVGNGFLQEIARGDVALDEVLDQGVPLNGALRQAAAASLGGLGAVTVHDGEDAASLADELGYEAFARDGHIVLGSAVANDENEVLAHEVAHVAQQDGGNGPGAGSDEDQADKAAASMLSGTPASVGPAQSGSVQPYEASEHKQMGDIAGDNTTTEINGVSFTMGEVAALADFFVSPEQALKAPEKELKELRRLIRKENIPKGVHVEQSEWNKATGGRYMQVTQLNRAHFAPQNEELVEKNQDQSKVNNLPYDKQVEYDHVIAWRKHYAKALQTAAGGRAKLNEAQVHLGFAEHYLQDAYSAGHLFNKDDFMARGAKTLEGMKQSGDFTSFLGQLATRVMGNKPSQDLLNKCEVKASLTGQHPVGPWLDLDSEFVFRKFLEGVSAKRKDVVPNALARALHNKLDRWPGGFPVEVTAGGKTVGLNLSGDETLHTAHGQKTKAMVQQAEKVGRGYVTGAAAAGKADVSGAIAAVVPYFPKPTAQSTKLIKSHVEQLTTPGHAMMEAISAVVLKNLEFILEEAAKMKLLRYKS